MSFSKPYEAAAAEERASLRKRNKELETSLKRAVTTLAKERHEHKLASQQEMQRRKGEDDTRRRWQLEMERELSRVRKEAEEKISKEQVAQNSKLRGTLSELNALEEHAKHLQEQERQQRVEMLQRQVARRIMNQGIIKGWTAWHSLYQEKVHQRRMLSRAAQRLTRPAVVAAYSTWRHSFEVEQQRRTLAAMRQREAALGQDSAALQSQMEQLRASYEARLASAEAARKALEQQLYSLNGAASDSERRLEEQMAKEKAERVELLRRQIGRRIKNQDILRGWVSWTAMWKEKVDQRNQMRQIANRLMVPEKSAAFAFWRQDWTSAQVKMQKRILQQREDAMGLGVQQLQNDLERVSSEYEKKMDSLVKERDNLRAALTTLTGDAEEALRKQNQELAEHKEKRIEHLCGMIARRMLKKDLARGWSAWHDMWTEEVTRKRRLQAATSRMRSPELAAFFSNWSELSKEARANKNERAHQEREERLGQGQAALAAELKKVRIEYEKKLQDAAEKERILTNKLIELDGGAADAAAKLKEQVEKERREREQRVEHLSGMIARRMLKKDLARGWSAWHDMWTEEVTRKRRLQAATSRMRSPELAAFFSNWSGLSKEARANKNERAHQEREERLGQRKEALAAELETVRDEYERRVATLEADRHKLQQRLAHVEAKLSAEVDAQEQQSSQLRDDHYSLLSQLEAQTAKEEKEREQRIENLRGMFARRFLKKDLALGFTAWYEVWTDRVQRQRALQRAASRLRHPERSAAFVAWKDDWEKVMRARAQKQQEERELVLQKGQADLASEHERARRELQFKLDASEAARRDLEQHLKQLGGGAAQTQAELEAQLTRQKEMRVEQLMLMIARRILRRDLTRGWQAWVESWAEKALQKRQLQQAANRLRKPEVAGAFSIWLQDWHSEQQKLKLAAQRAGHQESEIALRMELERVRSEYDKKLEDAVRREAWAMSQLAKLDGGTALAEQALQSQLEKEQHEREKRVEHLCGMIARRMLRKDISRGWAAWVGVWEEKVSQRRTLQKAASRLRSPVLSASFFHWLQDWEEAIKAAEMIAQRKREAEVGRDRGALEAELERVRSDYERRLTVAAEDKTRALQEQLEELLGNNDAELVAQKQKDKEARIEEVREKIARRLLNIDLTRGWTAWHDKWAEEVYKHNLMNKAVGRMGKPGVAGAFIFWVRDTKQIRQQIDREANEKRISEFEAELRQKGLEAGKLAMINTAMKDELQHLRAKAVTQANDIDAKRAALLAAEEEKQAFIQLQAQYKSVKDSLAESRRAHDDAVAHAARQQVESQALLEKLLEEQRQNAEVEQTNSKNKAARQSEELNQARMELMSLQSELSSTKATLKMLQAKNEKGKPSPPPNKNRINLSGEGSMPEQVNGL